MSIERTQGNKQELINLEISVEAAIGKMFQEIREKCKEERRNFNALYSLHCIHRYILIMRRLESIIEQRGVTIEELLEIYTGFIKNLYFMTVGRLVLLLLNNTRILKILVENFIRGPPSKHI